jgi:DNA replication protein DnaD
MMLWNDVLRKLYGYFYSCLDLTRLEGTVFSALCGIAVPDYCSFLLEQLHTVEDLEHVGISSNTHTSLTNTNNRDGQLTKFGLKNVSPELPEITEIVIYPKSATNSHPRNLLPFTTNKHNQKNSKTAEEEEEDIPYLSPQQ